MTNSRINGVYNITYTLKLLLVHLMNMHENIFKFFDIGYINHE